MLDQNKLEQIFEFLSVASKLKTTMRYGSNDMVRGDSSADHSWRVALMAIIFAEELNLDIDKYKAVKIALVHDLVETIAGDVDARLVALNIVTKEEKLEKEMSAIEQLKNILPGKVGEEVYELFIDFESTSSPEAKYVKALDKMEAQIKLVEDGYKVYDMPDLIADYARESVRKFPNLSGVHNFVMQKLKSEFKKGNFEWKEEYEIL